MGTSHSTAVQLEQLTAKHNVDSFDCGEEELNAFIKKNALQSMQQGSNRTLVVVEAGRVVAFISYTYGTVSAEQAILRMMKGVARHPQPILLLARMAVDKTFQGQRLGKALFFYFLGLALDIDDAARRDTVTSPAVAPLRGVAVHAKSEAVAEFYRSFGMEASPLSDRHLMMLMKDVRKALQGNAEA
ncbi:hypothetical protein ACM64Y_20275 [Novispirillum sp. DQ9]|uniref:hypothetical protein n=1 Tax=Novispirillum sp. DQ9 TaxID=3398612 RepID=UPI003C7B9872